MAPPSSRAQRTVKWAIRLMMPMFGLAGLGAYSSIAFIGLQPRKVMESKWSPTRSYRASIVEAYGAECSAHNSYTVVVERSKGYLKFGETAPFCFSGAPSQLVVAWVGPTDLAITCHACDQETIYMDRKNWGVLHYRYDVQGN